MKEQFPTNTTGQQKRNEANGEWSWRPATPPSFEDEEVHRRWEEKTRKAQETVRISSNFDPAGVLTEHFYAKFRLRTCPSQRSTES